MPVTLADAIYRVRSRLNEPTPMYYTDTELTQWVNDGLRDIARRAEDLITSDLSITIPPYSQNPNSPPPTFSLNLGNQIAVPEGQPQTSDVLRIYRVEFWLNGLSNQIYPMEWAPQAYLDQVWNINQISNMTYPTYWTTMGYPGGTGRNALVMQIYPVPSDGGLLHIYYYRLPYRIPDPVNNSANYNVTLDLIEGWDDMVIDFVHYQALIKARDPNWQVIQQVYESKMVNIIDQTRQLSNQAQYLSYDAMAMPWQFDGWGGWY